MTVVSTILDTAARLGGPRVAFEVELLRERRWGHLEAEWLALDRIVDRTRAAVDVGGNRGHYAGRLARLCPLVHCFEPIPWMAEALAARLPHRRVRVQQIALSDHAGEAELHIPYAADGEELNGLSTLEAGSALAAGGASVRTVRCRVARLDDVVQDAVGFVKVDVEGHELAVLHGAQGVLERDRPTLLVESQGATNAEAPANVFAFLAGLGYAGHFYEAGRLRGTAEFDARRHQVAENMGTERLYVNNFVFTGTPAAAQALPAEIA